MLQKTKTRKVNFSVPTSTDHREYTVTERCFLIAAGKPCFGCTMVNVQKPEAGIIDTGGLRTNVDFVIKVIKKQINEGINLLTFMGGDPLTIPDFEQVIKWTTNHPTLTGLIYSSSRYFFMPNGEFNRRFYDFEEAGLFEPNYFLSSVDKLVLKEQQIPGNDDSTAFKSYWGLKLTAKLAKMGYDVAIHQTLRTDNLDQTLKLYKWSKENGVKFSLCPLVWKPYISIGRQEEFYKLHLRKVDQPKLRGIISVLIDEESQRIKAGKSRQIIPSSAFLRLMPEFGPNNILSCKVHRKGLRPNTQDVHPNGETRWCIAQNKKNDGIKCLGCHYIGMDRGKSDFWYLEHLAGNLKKEDLRWLNYHVWKKDPKYDPSRRNIAFKVVEGEKVLPI